jgi:endonuclease YncB( thermonuclease family)
LISFKIIACFLLALIPKLIFSQEVTGIVSRVQDGDSFQLMTPDSIYKVRFFGIDCPELNQPFGEVARDFMTQYLSDTITIVKRDIDKYGRTIAEVFYKDTSLSFKLINTGLAWHYKKYSSDTTMSSAELVAMNNGVGLWSDTLRIAPWDWRSGNYNHELFQNKNETKVFVCIGDESQEYHRLEHCSDLNKCTSTVILVYPKEAFEVYHKTKCLKCLY